MVVDFSQFEALIDYIGGIDITVPVSFIDTAYPITGRENDTCQGDPSFACRYQTVEFVQGIQHMDGKRALMYVRSRHAEGNEGNDFSRGRRQQDVIIAIKTKILALEPWFHPDMSMRLFQSFDNATKTNLSVGQLLALGKLSMGIQANAIKKISIEPLLIEAPFEKYERYALEPKEGVLQIKEFIDTSLGVN
jgi:anionic cell wall polymer biosynthesis LytR-Cps2A-Psr (LCP) family protein